MLPYISLLATSISAKSITMLGVEQLLKTIHAYQDVIGFMLDELELNEQKFQMLLSAIILTTLFAIANRVSN